MGIVRFIASLLFVIAVPVALVTTSVRIAANEPRVYEYATDHYDTTETTGIDRDELLRASGELRDYFNNGEETIFVQVTTQDSQLISLFNPRETAHLRDVKDLFQTAFRVQEGAVIFALAYIVAVFIWAREGSLRTLAKQLVISGIAGLLVIGVVGLVAVTGFDAAFERFHLIAFDNDLWRLDPDTDHLIQMFPENFWRDLSVWVGIATLAELGALTLAAAVYLRFVRPTTVPTFLASHVQA
ncbi:MAG: TIGR01906 family membrane protein [Dehalococcoidia bacterium]